MTRHPSTAPAAARPAAALALAGVLAALAAAATGAAAAEPAPSRPAVEKESPAALIRRCMAAYGGERARVRLGRVRVTGTIRSKLHPGQDGVETRLFARSARLRVEVAFPGSEPEVRVLDGARAFRYGQPAPGPVALSLQLQVARLDLPALLEEWESRVEDLGKVEYEGQDLRVLGLETSPGVRIEAGLDPGSARIIYVRGVARNGPSQLEVFTVYRNFRMVDGVLVPFREEGWTTAESTGDLDLTRVEFLDEVPEGSFAP
jgi:hypothetical protein